MENSTYPIVLIPKQILNVDSPKRSSLDILEASGVKCSQKPLPPQIPLLKTVYSSQIKYNLTLTTKAVVTAPVAFFFVFMFIYGIEKYSEGAILFFIGALYLAFLSIRVEKQKDQIVSNENKRYNDQILKKYKDDLDNYKKQSSKYEVLLEKQASLFKEDFFLKDHQRRLSVFENPSRITVPEFRGKYELIFLEKVKFALGSNIKMDLGYGSNGYRPDITYTNPKYNLYLDVEIDEPYFNDFNKVIPTHYIDSDDVRNAFFLNKNWVIVRFCEKQIAKYPDECCKFLIDLIYSIEYNQPIKTDLPLFPKWSYEDALIMGNENYRNTYKIQKLSYAEAAWYNKKISEEV